MKILVVGGTRFFGIPMVRELIENGHSVTVASRGSHADPFGENVRRIHMDKTDPDSVKSAVCGEHFDVLIDKVAYSSNDVISLLSSVSCDRYIQMSSCAVYSSQHLMIKESEFDAKSCELVLMDRPDDYALGKRLAERAALEFKEESECVFVRYPVVLGKNDYTARLRFYVSHVCHGLPMNIEHPDAAAAYISENEAGRCIAQLVDKQISGAVNGCSVGVISQRSIISHIEKKCGKSAVISQSGEKAPFDDICCDVSYDCTKAESIGLQFSKLSSWLVELTDCEISKII